MWWAYTWGGLIFGGGGGLIVRSLRYRGEHLVLHIEAGV